MKILAKNQKFWKKRKVWAKLQTFVKKRKFRQKSISLVINQYRDKIRFFLNFESREKVKYC